MLYFVILFLLVFVFFFFYHYVFDIMFRLYLQELDNMKRFSGISDIIDYPNINYLKFFYIFYIFSRDYIFQYFIEIFF